MCNCINEVEKKILEEINKNSEGRNEFNVTDGEFEHLSIYPKVKLFIKYLFKYSYTKKNGERSKPINHSINIFFSFCPFCGEKIEN